MPILPISKKQLDKLGDRLRDGAAPEPADLDLLGEVLEVYGEALNIVLDHLRRLGFDPAVRVKTTGTIISKLQRDRVSSLKTIQDLAGARVVILGDLDRQDAVVDRFCASGITAGPA